MLLVWQVPQAVAQLAHSNSTRPVSRDVIARDLGDLPKDVIAKIVHGTCAKLYDLPLP